ncbi:hypothetical protein BC834DRAFT_823004 [Gloeopeniophorella convolvens]|nr:hypothetical protein BC834DRAFT_823004 [Gloeopeniophorella convolvens]
MSSFSVNELLTPGSLTLITDQRAAPGDFILHQLLSDYVRSAPDGRCIIVSATQDLAKWKAISSRSGFNLNPKIEQGTITFIDIPTQLPTLSPSDNVTLLPILDLIRRSMAQAKGSSRTLLIIDDLATLEWIGHSALDISRFARAAVALCAKDNVDLAVRHHVATPNDLDSVVRTLLQLAAYHIEVLPLLSGRSGAISGEIAIHAGVTLSCAPKRVIARSRALQYRLGDYHAVYFERGTGQAVL